ncbi:ATP-binding protein [Streptomyces sp. NBC_00996]|uniref:ATP-binding response regulator n=1 Tax=Streptomyces sp. NBC_00996 TaxID=2903710 RepID=UPI0038671C60|nr:HAMP domain-containing histidine kinase [Streptomyces sp. NBC_00996]
MLVAEDDEKQAELIRRSLLKEGHTATVVHDGGAALAEARRHRPDLVVLDLMLPVVDGFGVCRMLRQSDDIPVLMLTARSTEDDILLGLELGADDYMTKPLAVAFNELTERRERMEAQRKAMVTDIAHELRTPLTNIRGWLEVTRDGIVDPDPELLASLHEEAVVLQRVIDDLQDLAAGDAGALKLHRGEVRADELLEQVAAAHRVGAEAAGIRLLTSADGTPWLDADPVRMRQALGNLVSNAIRHTPADGTITLSVRGRDGQVVFEVADTGTGIAPEDLPSVFDRFWRAEKSRSRRTGGSGLGLPIVRQLVAAHGGTVTVNSEPGVGSVFTLRLPCTTAHVSPAVEAD